MSTENSLLIRAARPEDRLALQRMLELYQYELSDIWDQDLDAQGEYGYALDRYFHSPECTAFIAQVGGRHAGFALADRAVKVAPDGNWMDQFFVLKKYRGAGVGTRLACAVFNAVPGYWEVGQMPANAGAQEFWRRVIGQYTGDSFVEHAVTAGAWQGVVQSFHSRQG